MPYGHLIAATVMTLSICQGHSSIASFTIQTSASRGPSAIAELLVEIIMGHLQRDPVCIWPDGVIMTAFDLRRLFSFQIITNK